MTKKKILKEICKWQLIKVIAMRKLYGVEDSPHLIRNIFKLRSIILIIKKK